jgi:hypothetical protein
LLRRCIGTSPLLSLLQPPSLFPSLCDCYRPSTLAEESIKKKEKAEKSIFIYGTTFKKNESGPDFQQIQIWNDRSQKQKKDLQQAPTTTDYLTIENFPPQEGISKIFGWKSLPDGQKLFLVVDNIKIVLIPS